MHKLRQAVVVEGKYDANALRQLIDAPVFETGGFRGIADSELIALLRAAARARGLIILTDSDGAGFVIRNRLKIRASIKNSRIFRSIREEYGSFDAYIWGWTDGKILYENDPAVTTGPLSDAISKDLKKRGMTFVGSTIIYAYLQAIGVIYAHSDECWLHSGK